MLPNTSVDVILGTSFFVENEIMFDFGNKVLILENPRIEMPTRDNGISLNDKDQQGR